MKRSRLLFLIASASLPTAAAAEIKSSSASGFVLESRAVVPIAPDAAFAALGRIGTWWTSSHTYSGKAANLRLDLRAGGCFCESWSGGSVEYGRVVHARLGQQLRLSAALGPLQAEAVTGTLTWTFKPAAAGTEIVQSYVVGGYIVGGADKYAGPVDRVMTEQFAGLIRSLGK